MNRLFVVAVGLFACTASDGFATTLYGINSTEKALYRIDPSTGVAELVGPLGVDRAINDLAYDPTTRTVFGYGGSVQRLRAIDTVTGQATPVLPFSAGAVTSIAFDTSTNTMYATQSATAELLTLDTSDSSFTTIAPFTDGILAAMTYDSDRDQLFGFDDVADRFVTIDRTTGTATQIALTAPQRPAAVAYDAETGTMFAIEILSDQLMTVDVDTGVLTPIGGTNLNGISSLVAVPSIPEPSSAAICSLATLAFVWAKRRAVRLEIRE